VADLQEHMSLLVQGPLLRSRQLFLQERPQIGNRPTSIVVSTGLKRSKQLGAAARWHGQLAQPPLHSLPPGTTGLFAMGE